MICFMTDRDHGAPTHKRRGVWETKADEPIEEPSPGRV
jgi:hypothetical protein